MKRVGRFLAALSLALVASLGSPTTTVAAEPPIRALEQAIETRSGALLLPGGGLGTVTVTPCSGCRPLGLLAGGTTAWMIGERAVGYDDLRRVLQSNPRVPVLLFYDGRSRSLTRLVARAGAQAAP
ncbi:MAG: hypothetical protein MUF07_01705 [Steroidobacteraceae bacterium]|jgi:hypothetical protein|nr:hypothetical protein [Steroidobacteraceae bacterium]